MAKLMAPNIRIDWYPEGHFADIHNPTIAELNSGVNLSCAIVTGYTLDFTDSNTENTTTIFDTHTSEAILNHSYEADLEFFLAPRGSNADNEAAYRKAEELFYNNRNRVGYLAKRFGFPWNREYDRDEPRQRLDMFKVQADLPKVVSEEGAPILLNVKYIPQGEAVSSAKAGAITYEWEGEPHASTSVKKIDGEVVARNHVPVPSFENSVSRLYDTSGVATLSRSFWIYGVTQGDYCLEISYTGASVQTNARITLTDISDFQPGTWAAFAVDARQGGPGVRGATHIRTRLEFFQDSARVAASSAIYQPLGVTPERFSQAVQVPSEPFDEVQAIFWLQGSAGYTAAEDGKTFTDAWQVTVADTEQEALAQVAEYFDGDSPSE